MCKSLVRKSLVRQRQKRKCSFYVERGSSVVECQTRKQVSLGSNPPFATVSKIGHFCSRWKCDCDLVVARNCCMARMLPGEADLVSE